MDKKLLLSILLIISVFITSNAQINKELVKNTPLLVQKSNLLKTSQFSEKTLIMAYTLPYLQSTPAAPTFNSNIGPAQNAWISEIQHSEIQLNNIMIRTDHYYGLNSTLIGSSLNIKLSKHVSYRIFPN
ncbi:MAG TPA: hypothetical protein PKL31_09365 [Fulvivirga sp.]|nr:hypothetical protein [Fulvivirga sp.]